MKKLILCLFLPIISLTSYSQDTICVYFKQDNVHVFNYYTDSILNSTTQETDFYEIEVYENQVLCLHLSDRALNKRKVKMIFSDGESKEDILDSKDNAYYTSAGAGPFKVLVGKPKLSNYYTSK